MAADEATATDIDQTLIRYLEREVQARRRTALLSLVAVAAFLAAVAALAWNGMRSRDAIADSVADGPELAASVDTHVQTTLSKGANSAVLRSAAATAAISALSGDSPEAIAVRESLADELLHSDTLQDQIEDATESTLKPLTQQFAALNQNYTALMGASPINGVGLSALLEEQRALRDSLARFQSEQQALMQTIATLRAEQAQRDAAAEEQFSALTRSIQTLNSERERARLDLDELKRKSSLLRNESTRRVVPDEGVR
jgi:hypothetical protein